MNLPKLINFLCTSILGSKDCISFDNGPSINVYGFGRTAFIF